MKNNEQAQQCSSFTVTLCSMFNSTMSCNQSFHKWNITT